MYLSWQNNDPKTTDFYCCSNIMVVFIWKYIYIYIAIIAFFVITVEIRHGNIFVWFIGHRMIYDAFGIKSISAFQESQVEY